jgi:hypothetical protein
MSPSGRANFLLPFIGTVPANNHLMPLDSSEVRIGVSRFGLPLKC